MKIKKCLDSVFPKNLFLKSRNYICGYAEIGAICPGLNSVVDGFCLNSSVNMFIRSCFLFVVVSSLNCVKDWPSGGKKAEWDL